ncbi:unnamed protein product [Cylicocyclus nassatus]|uniref:Uncharacterized protein n=1 Tax=Cylicocyclus nassatus TaxID=53992 RepID=A0AA36DKH7_CYLNA|nr:unnamed protein product [Cylicocyclus nassatus]
MILVPIQDNLQEINIAQPKINFASRYLGAAMTETPRRAYEASAKTVFSSQKKMAVPNPYMEQTNYGLCTSTPHPGFYPFLPPFPAIFSPFTSYYPRYENSSTSSSTGSSYPSTSSEEESKPVQPAVDRCSPPPRLLPYNTSLVSWPMIFANSWRRRVFATYLQSEDSGFSTSSPAEATPLRRNSLRGYKKTFCAICKVNINRDGKRSQGPRRHLLQHHVQRPLFQCPHCSHSSFYDKFHVTSHMRRIHQDNSDKIINRSSEFVEEVNMWYKRCFGEGNEMMEKTEIAEGPSCQLYSSPPPVLTPEPACKENIQPEEENPEALFQATAPKRRKRGFMVADLLQVSSTHSARSEF